MKHLSREAQLGLGLILAILIGLSIFLIGKVGLWSLLLVPGIIGVIFLFYFIFKNPFFGFLSIIFFLPFERFPTYNLGGVDIRINVILGLLTLLAWALALMFNAKKWKLQSSSLTIPVIFFVIALLLSLTQAYAVQRAGMVLFFTIFTIGLAFLTVNMANSSENLKKIISVLFISSLVAGAFGLFQFGGDVVGLPQSITLLKIDYTSKVFGFPRVQSFSMEPLYFANLLIIPISLILAYLFAKDKTYKVWLLLGLFLLLGLNFVLTVSRGGYVGLAASILVFVLFYFKKIFTWQNIIAGIIAIALVGYGVVFALSKGDYRSANEFIGHVLLRDYKVGESVQGRLATFRQALKAYSWSPVVGIGLGNYGPNLAAYPIEPPKSGWAIVNNQYFETLAETGIVGLTFFFLLILTLLVQSVRAIRIATDPFLKATMVGLLAAFVGVLVQYNFFSTLYIIHIWILIGLMAATQNLILKKKVV